MSKFPEAEQTRLVDRLLAQAAGLSQGASEAERDVAKYLMAVNAGGVVAFLSFIGRSQIASSSTIYAVGCFVFGIASVGFMQAIAALRLRWVSNEMTKKVYKFYHNQIALRGTEGEWPKFPLYVVILSAIAAFAFFISGCCFAYNALKSQPSNQNGKTQAAINTASNSPASKSP